MHAFQAMDEYNANLLVRTQAENVAGTIREKIGRFHKLSINHETTEAISALHRMLADVLAEVRRIEELSPVADGGGQVMRGN